MKSISSSPLFLLFASARSLPPPLLCFVPYRSLHTSQSCSAIPQPITAAGPPPSAPLPAASQYGPRVDRRRRQAELVKKGQEIRGSQTKPSSAMKKRFWKDVHVKQDENNNHIVYLDTRPVRNPNTKTPLLIPPSKPHLATAIALEWDNLTSAQQALRSHLIPLTSIASRAQSLAIEDAKNITDTGAEAGRRGEVLGGKGEGIRYDIVNTLLRYLDTDTLLCWAPDSSSSSASDAAAARLNIQAPVFQESRSSPPSFDSASKISDEDLRSLQIRTATPILAYLTQHLWPGVDLRPGLDAGSILPRSQPPATRAVIKGWLTGLPAWELVGLERAVLAGKSLCIGARLIGEWGETLRGQAINTLGGGAGSQSSGEQSEEAVSTKRFGVEEAADASSLEVRWQTGQWGEVEDTHDVDKEDLARQLGSAVLVVSGSG